MTRDEFTASLRALATGATLTLGVPEREWPIAMVARRDGRKLMLFLPRGYGVTLHRNGGIFLPRVPRRGGASILWGKARERVHRLGRDHRAFELGPVGIYIGSDF